MKLAAPPMDYSAADQARMRDALSRADAENHKRGRDVEIGAGRLILTDPASGGRYVLSVASGALNLTPL